MPLLNLITLLFLTITGWSQAAPHKELPPALITCTSQVPAKTCVHGKGTFFAAQKTSAAMHSVEVVLADRHAFQQENESLKTKSQRAMLNNPSSAELNGPQLGSPFRHSILFEVGVDGIVTKVVICVDLFDQVDVDQLEKGQGHVTAPVAFDKDSVATWATYVMGYVDGCFWSRSHSMAEQRENTPQK